MEKEIEIKRVTFKLTIDGVAHKVIKPTMRMIKAFTARQKEIEKNKDSEDAVVDESTKFLVDLGLPENVVEGLDPEMLEEVTLIVTGQKKS